jgi:hypothetical protein
MFMTVDEVGEEEVPNIRQQRILYIGPQFFQLLGRAYCGTLWLGFLNWVVILF